MYSDMSMRINASSESNMNVESTLANCVLPTPVGPRKMNDPIGLLGSFNPARLRLMAFTTFLMASSWPMTLPSRSVFMRANFPLSFSAMR